jgi:hypothetical protein
MAQILVSRQEPTDTHGTSRLVAGSCNSELQ